MRRIICVGHAALDRVYRIAEIPKKATKVRALEYLETGGGMAANAAAAIARLGGSVELWSRIGEDDAGVAVRRGLRAVGVDVRYVQAFEEGRTSTSAIMVDDDGERLIVGARDVNMPSGTSWLPMERIREVGAVLADMRWMEAARAVLEEARENGITTVLDVDVGGREALTEILPLADYAIFSAGALNEFAAEEALEDRLARVAALGPKHAGVTLGADGYLWREGGGTHRCEAFEVDVVDTTGAGDTFHGAFTLAVTEGKSSAGAARFGCAAAALKCTRLGARAGQPSRREVAALISGKL